MYQTLRATVRKGRIELLEEVSLPDDTVLLVTIIEAVDPATLTLGEHLERGLADILRGSTTNVRTGKELKRHLDLVFGED